jgi:hypothetical protein
MTWRREEQHEFKYLGTPILAYISSLTQFPMFQGTIYLLEHPWMDIAGSSFSCRPQVFVEMSGGAPPMLRLEWHLPCQAPTFGVSSFLVVPWLRHYAADDHALKHSQAHWQDNPNPRLIILSDVYGRLHVFNIMGGGNWLIFDRQGQHVPKSNRKLMIRKQFGKSGLQNDISLPPRELGMEAVHRIRPL